MRENQNVEFKRLWKDEYLKWICGYANAEGGKLYIGIDDEGTVFGLQNAAKLLADIPNKVRDTLGIIVNVNMHTDPASSLTNLEISVDPHPFPVNYKGTYHYRSGSTGPLPALPAGAPLGFGAGSESPIRGPLPRRL